MSVSNPSARKAHPRWRFHLYVSDTSPRSVLAQGNLRSLCERYIKNGYRVTIIDVQKEPAKARRHNILAIPALVWVQPHRTTTMIGTLGDTEKVLQVLGIAAQNQTFASQLPPGFSRPAQA